MLPFFFFSSRRRHTRWTGDWSSDVCSSDLGAAKSHPVRHLPPIQSLARMLLSRIGRTKTYRQPGPLAILTQLYAPRSEERRVGKECRSRWSRDDDKKEIEAKYSCRPHEH